MRYSISAFLLACSVQWVFAAGPSAAINTLGTTSLPYPSADVLSVTTADLALTTITLVNPEIEITNENLDFQICQIATLAGEPIVSEPGAPALPRVSRMYRIPELGGVDLVVRAAEYDVIENYNAFPYPIEEAESKRYEQDPAFYRQNAWYPESVAETSEPMIFRDFRIATVTLNPVQVNPVTRQARVYHNITVDIVANDQPGVNELVHPHRPSGAFASLYRDCIRNLEEGALDDETTTPGTYLILARENATLNSWVDSLVEWRTRCGFDVAVERFQSLPTVLQVKNAVQNVYDTSDPPLEHVCIIGDPLGSFALPTGANGTMDHYFARLAGEDIIPDVSIGRISVANESQMATAWNKLMAYERQPLIDTTDWFTNSLLYAITGMDQPSNYLEVQWADQQLRHFTGIQNNSISFAVSSANGPFVQSHFNSGIGLFLYAGFWVGSLQDITSNCLSGHRQPICVLMAGGTGLFDNSTSLSESFALAGTPTSLRGGVAAIGYTSFDENGPFFRTFGLGFINGLCALQLDRVGLCQIAGFMELHETYGATNQIYTQRLTHVNLIGDPAIRMWTGVPAVLSVTHPTPIATGTREVRVTVSDSVTGAPISDALVVAWKQNEALTRVLTDTSGVAILPVTIDSIGVLKLTVTKHNCKPYLADIPSQPTELIVTLDSLTIDDDNTGGTSGNDNHEFNPGEVIDMNIVLKNFGTTTAGTDITAELTSLSPDVLVVNSNSDYQDLQPGEQASGNSAFRIQMSPDMQNNTAAVLQLLVTASNDEAISAIPIVSRAGDAEYHSHEIIDLPLDPGAVRDLTISIFNHGLLALNSVSGTLVSRDPFVTVTDNSGFFGNIAVGSSSTNVANVFTVMAHPTTFRGHQAPMRLITETSTGFHDTVDFSIACGEAEPTDPTGPDVFGYYAYDDVDTSYVSHPSFEYIDLSGGGIGENLHLDDPGEKTLTTQVYSVVRALPFPFTYYDQTFDSITICSNGWIAFGNESWCDEPFNRPIPAVMAPPNMVAVYWDDLRTSATGDGVWVYYDHDMDVYVIQWRATGGLNYTEANLDFEIMILNPVAYPSLGENGKIVFLYRDVTMNLGRVEQYEDIGGCTIGVQDQTGSRGLQIAHRDQYAPGAAEIVDGRVILFQTDVRPLLGNMEGLVTDVQTGAPVPNTVVSVTGHHAQDTTDAEGYFRINDILVGTYTAIARRTGYNDAVASDFEIEFDSTEIVNFSLLHPEFESSRDTIRESLVEGPTLQTSFGISNAGNGPLDYEIEIVFTTGGELVRPWENLGQVNVSEITQDTRIHGCEFVNDAWYATGSNGANGNNYVYSFSRDGNLLRSFVQPSVDPIGMFDLAWDGQYLYGSEQGTGIIQGFDFEGNDQATVPCTYVNPARAIAYDSASDHFWIADLTSDIFEINRLGNLISTIDNISNLPISGLAWHPDASHGYSLYALCQQNATTLWRIHPTTHDWEFVSQLSGDAGDQAAGCAITNGWNNAIWVFGAIIQNQIGDRLGIFNMEFNSSWITAAPMNSSVGAGQSQQVTLNFNGMHLRPDVYHISLMVNCPVLELTAEIPVELAVIFDSTPSDDIPLLPERYALHQNYPNPFNPSTTISYDLKTAGLTSLKVYNITGQEVAKLVEEYQSAGVHRILFSNRDLPSGIYFARLNSGSFTKTTKMVLLK